MTALDNLWTSRTDNLNLHEVDNYNDVSRVARDLARGGAGTSELRLTEGSNKYRRETVV